MLIANFFNIIEILMLVETFMVMKSKTVNKKSKSYNFLNDSGAIEKVIEEKKKLASQKNKFFLNLLKQKNRRKFLFDINNLLKFEETKIHFNKKLQAISTKYEIEPYLFIFENFDENLFKRTRHDTRNNSFEVIKQNNLYNANNNNDNNINNNNNKKINFIKSKKSISVNKTEIKTKLPSNSVNSKLKPNTLAKTKNLNSNKAQENLDINKFTTDNKFINNINKNDKSMKLIIRNKPNFINIPDNSSDINGSAAKDDSINKNKESSAFSDFLYRNNLIDNESSMIILISQRQIFVKFSLGEKLVNEFSYEDEKQMAENFIKIFAEENIEFAIDDLIENIEILLQSKYHMRFFKLLSIIFAILSFLIFHFWLKRKNQRKPKNSTRAVVDNISIIKKITKKNLIAKNSKDYSDNSCMICLEDIIEFSNNKFDEPTYNTQPCCAHYISQSPNFNSEEIKSNKNEDFYKYLFSLHDKKQKQCTDELIIELLNSFEFISQLAYNNQNEKSNSINDFTNNSSISNTNSTNPELLIEKKYKSRFYDSNNFKYADDFQHKAIISALTKSDELTSGLASNGEQHINIFFNEEHLISSPSEIKKNKDEYISTDNYHYYNNVNKDAIFSYQSLQKFNINNDSFESINSTEGNSILHYNFSEKQELKIQRSQNFIISNICDIENIFSDIHNTISKELEDQFNSRFHKNAIKIKSEKYNEKNLVDINMAANIGVSLPQLTDEEQTGNNQKTAPGVNYSNLLEKFDKEYNENFPAILNCGHKFHTKCIALWMTRGAYCPICRGAVYPEADEVKKQNQLAENHSDLFESDFNDSIDLSYNEYI